MDPKHASIAGRLFFSQAEKNQKAKRRGEKLYGEDGRGGPEGRGCVQPHVMARRAEHGVRRDGSRGSAGRRANRGGGKKKEPLNKS